MLMKLKGAMTVVSDRHAGKRESASTLGADAALRPSQLAGAVRKLTGNRGFDFVIECTGRPEVWESAMLYVRPGGTVVLFGGAPVGSSVCFDTYRLHYGEITVKGAFHFTPTDVKKAYGYLKGRKIPTHALISGTYPLEKLESALKSLKRGEGIKYAIIP